MHANQKHKPATSTPRASGRKSADNGNCVRLDIHNPLQGFKLALAYALSLGVQADVALLLGINQAQVSRWARGVRSPMRKDIPRYTRRLAGFIQRRSRKIVA